MTNTRQFLRENECPRTLEWSIMCEAFLSHTQALSPSLSLARYMHSQRDGPSDKPLADARPACIFLDAHHASFSRGSCFRGAQAVVGVRLFCAAAASVAGRRIYPPLPLPARYGALGAEIRKTNKHKVVRRKEKQKMFGAETLG
eukprot:111093-Rhodomonas_salina.1